MKLFYILGILLLTVTALGVSNKIFWEPVEFKDQTLLADGTQAAPSMSFKVDPDTGWHWGGADNQIKMSLGNTLGWHCLRNTNGYINCGIGNVASNINSVVHWWIRTLDDSADVYNVNVSTGSASEANWILQTGGSHQVRFRLDGPNSADEAFKTRGGIFAETTSDGVSMACEKVGCDFRVYVEGDQDSDEVMRVSLGGVLSLLQETTTPTTPAAGGSFYVKSDNLPYFLDDAGVEAQLSLGAGGGSNSPYGIENLGFVTAAGSGALTIDLTQKDGSTDPTVSDSVDVAFRDTTITGGGYTTQSFTAATSIIIPSGATLGYDDLDDAVVYFYTIYDGTNLELAVSSVSKDEAILHSTTAIGAGSDVNALYSTTGRTGAAIRLVARTTVDAITTAGTWTTPDELTLNQNQISLIILREVESKSSSPTTWPFSANAWGDLTNVVLTPGKWSCDGAIIFGDSGATNAIRLDMGISTVAGNTSSGLTIGDNRMYTWDQTTTNRNEPLYVNNHRVEPSSTTTFYLKGNVSNSTSNMDHDSYRITCKGEL